MKLIRSPFFLFVLQILLNQVANGHAVWKYPQPRDPGSGIKAGPCGGPNFGSISDNIVTVLNPGPLVVSWKETIFHRGAPFRIALGIEDEDSGFDECMLLDHIPHNDNAGDDQHYEVTVDIPDVSCDRCTLQLIQIMTDKLGGQYSCHYYEDCTQRCSEYGDECFSNYHSCANVIIDGATHRDDITCALPDDWPFQLTPLEYGNEADNWSVDGQLCHFIGEDCETEVYVTNSSLASTSDPENSDFGNSNDTPKDSYLDKDKDRGETAETNDEIDSKVWILWVGGGAMVVLGFLVAVTCSYYRRRQSTLTFDLGPPSQQRLQRQQRMGDMTAMDFDDLTVVTDDSWQSLPNEVARSRLSSSASLVYEERKTPTNIW